MGKIKLVATDLDATLLNDEKKISEKNNEALGMLNRNGIKLVYSSGRHYDAVKTVTDGFRYADYVIASGGPLLTEADGSVMFSSCFERAELMEIIDFVKSKGYYLQLCTVFDHFLFEKKCIHSDTYERLGVCEGDEIGDFNKVRCEINKVMVVCDPSETDEMQRTFREAFPGYSAYKSQPDYLEIVCRNVSKVNTLKILCGRIGIEMEEVLSIGDEDIDLEMLNSSGVGACPVNASTSVTAAADYVSPFTNNESAVADIIMKYCL